MTVYFNKKNNSESKNNDSLELNSKKESALTDKINNYLLRFTRVPLKEKLFFVQHLGIMLKAGISLSTALKTLSKQTKNPRFIKVLQEISDNVEKGKNFAESLVSHKDIFGEMFVNMIEAGEISGKLEEVLSQLFIQMKKDHQIISKVKGALTYPIVIVFAVIGIGAFMFVVIIPQMIGMFKEMDAELPLATQIIISISDAIQHHGLIVLISIITFIVAFIKIISTEKGKFYFQALMLKMPILSPIIKKINLARFSRNISSLLKTDIMIVKSFQITANVLSNLHYRKALNDMSQKIKKGGKINEVVAAYPDLFTPVVQTMIAVGEETGELDNILVEVAEFYEEEVNQVMENLPSIIEPLLILVLGLGVGGMAVAIIMPMYSIGSSI